MGLDWVVGLFVVVGGLVIYWLDCLGCFLGGWLFFGWVISVWVVSMVVVCR